MKTYEMDRLTRNVFGRNLINRLTIENLVMVLPQIESFIGKKVAKADNTKTKAFDIKLPEFKNNEGQMMRVSLRFKGDEVVLWQDVTVADTVYSSGGYGVNYYANSIKIGTTNADGFLTSVEKLENITTTYKLNVVHDATEVKAIRAKIEILKDELRDLNRQVADFGEF